MRVVKREVREPPAAVYAVDLRSEIWIDANLTVSSPQVSPRTLAAFAHADPRFRFFQLHCKKLFQKHVVLSASSGKIDYNKL